MQAEVMADMKLTILWTNVAQSNNNSAKLQTAVRSSDGEESNCYLNVRMCKMLMAVNIGWGIRDGCRIVGVTVSTDVEWVH
jgi:hypothetical protein